MTPLPPPIALSRRTSPPRWSTAALGRLVSTWLLATATCTVSIAQAQDAPYEDIQRLIRADQPAQAIERADAWLAQRPKDPQVRFLKGMAQTHLGDTEAAYTTYTELVRDYPELPEPQNNLAVLHAKAGRLDQARAALETAVQLNPGYAIAHQNLGDVYLRLASQAYRTSLKLSPTATLHNRLRALDALTTPAPLR